MNNKKFIESRLDKAEDQLTEALVNAKEFADEIDATKDRVIDELQDKIDRIGDELENLEDDAKEAADKITAIVKE